MSTPQPGSRRSTTAWQTVTLAALMMLVVAACGSITDVADGEEGGPAAGDEGVEPGAAITMARATWDTGFMQAYIYRDLLEELGYEVSDPAEATLDPNVFYPALARGQYDFWANGWFPLHDIYLERELFTGEQEQQPISPVGTEVDGGALQGYLVDKRTADELGLTSMSDFANPDVAAAFDEDGNGKADLIGCNEGWGCNTQISEHIDRLDWGDNVEQVVGQYSELIADVEAKVSAGDPVLFYTWTPNWTVDVLAPGTDVVWLESPALPSDEGETTAEGLAGCATASDACDLGWLVNDIRVVANDDFLSENPTAQALFEAVKIPLDDIAQQNAEMNAAGESYTDADIAQDAAEWIEANRATVDGWLEQARSST